MSHDEADVSLVNEELTAKCNALNIKPDVEEVTSSPDVEVVKPAGTPPPIPDSVVIDLVNKQKRKKSLFMTFVALVVLAAVGMAGYGYYSKHKTEAVLLDSLLEDSMVTVNELETDTTNQDSINQDTTKDERNKKSKYAPSRNHPTRNLQDRKLLGFRWLRQYLFSKEYRV